MDKEKVRSVIDESHREKQVCAPYEQAEGLAKVGIFDVMAEKVRQAIAVATFIVEGECIPPYTLSNLVLQEKIAAQQPPLALFGQLQLEMIAARQQGQNQSFWLYRSGENYAELASLAGQPELVMRAVERMRKLVEDDPDAFALERALRSNEA